MNVLGNGHGFEETIIFSIFRDVHDAIAHCRSWDPIADGATQEANFPAMEQVPLQRSSNDLHRFRSSRSNKPEHSSNLAIVDTEGCVSDNVGHRNVVDAQDLRFRPSNRKFTPFACAVQLAGKIAPYHRLNDLLAREVPRWPRGHPFTIAQYRDGVGVCKSLFQ